jgi:hypothetical protein
MRAVSRRSARIAVVAALALSAIATWDVAATGAGAQPAPTPVQATVGATPTGGALPPGFVGVSLEYEALHVYTGQNPNAINPVFLSLLRGLTPGQAPVIRIGGNSSDQSWWPIRGMIPPPGVSYALTPGWLRTTRALAARLGAKLIMGINLAAGRPAIAAAEARALLTGIGSRYIEAFEIGNEPDVYTLFPWYHRGGRAIYARSDGWDVNAYTSQIQQWEAAMPTYPLAGPALAELAWLTDLPAYVAAAPTLKVVTVHRYPLRACDTSPTNPMFASIPHLLDAASSRGLAQSVAPYVANIHNDGLALRIGEMNSAACSGKRGVSDTFASALWVLDTLFNMASVGVDGVNIHSLPHAAYELFTFKRQHHSWEAFVHPEYYGMLMFAQAFPPGAQLLPVTTGGAAGGPNGPVQVWATRDSAGRLRVVAINKDSAAHTLDLQLPGIPTAGSVESLTASGVTATSGVKLGGQSFGAETKTGTLPGTPHVTTVTPQASGQYTLNLPAASALMLTTS